MLTNFGCKAPTRIRRTLVLSNYTFRLIASQFLIVKVKHGAISQSPSFDSTACRKYFAPWGHILTTNMLHAYGLCPWLWWKFDSSVSEHGIFLSQLPYNERSQISQGLSIPPSRCFQR